MSLDKHPFDRIPCEGFGVTLDKCPMPKKPMTRQCAMQILAAEKRWGKGTMRTELLAEAKKAME